MEKMNENKEKGRKELKDKVLEQKKTYEDKNIFKSEKYTNHVVSYTRGNSYQISRRKMLDNINLSQSFAKKVVDNELPPIEDRNKSLIRRFPKDGDKHIKWFYGRFGTKELSESLDVNVKKEYFSKNHELGNYYMQDSVIPLTDEQKKSIFIRRNEKSKEAKKKTSISIDKFDYLTVFREQRETLKSTGKHK